MARELQRTDPRKVRIAYERGPKWYPVWDNNPRLAGLEEKGDFNWFSPRQHGLRPYTQAKSATKWVWQPYRPPVGEFYFKPWELGFGDIHKGAVVLGPYLKRGASPNKQWGWERWDALARKLSVAGLRLTTLGADQRQPLACSDHVQTDIRQAAALLARARLLITHEGALHHIAAAVGTPTVVIYGGYVAPSVTGYDSQVNLFTGGGLGCGMRVPCEHCAEAMEMITPQIVFEKAMGLLDGVR